MFRQDRTNPSSAVSNWKGRRDTARAWPSTAVSSWLNGGLFGGGSRLSPKKRREVNYSRQLLVYQLNHVSMGLGNERSEQPVIETTKRPAV